MAQSGEEEKEQSRGLKSSGWGSRFADEVGLRNDR